MYFSILFSYKFFSSRMIMVRYGERGEEEGGRGWSGVRCDAERRRWEVRKRGECGDTEATSNARVGRACPIRCTSEVGARHASSLYSNLPPRFFSL